MQCPLCGKRAVRRSCPALSQLICAVCCGTKRLTEIACPSDCGYLATSRAHPPVAAVRQQQVIAQRVTHFVRDLSDQQTRLFLALNAFFAAHQSDGLQSLIDQDVEEATDALAATYETAARGLIYEHQPASRIAERLAREMKPVMTEARQGFTSSFDAGAAVVLRRIAESVRELRKAEGHNRRAYLEFATLVVRLTDEAAHTGDLQRDESPRDVPRLIVP